MLVVVCLRGKNLATKETNENHLRNETRASENAAKCIPRQTTLNEHFKKHTAGDPDAYKIELRTGEQWWALLVWK